MLDVKLSWQHTVAIWTTRWTSLLHPLLILVCANIRGYRYTFHIKLLALRNALPSNGPVVLSALLMQCCVLCNKGHTVHLDFTCHCPHTSHGYSRCEVTVTMTFNQEANMELQSSGKTSMESANLMDNSWRQSSFGFSSGSRPRKWIPSTQAMLDKRQHHYS